MSAVPYERLFSTVGYIVNETHPSILLICSFACVVGHPTKFELENTCAIYCVN